MTTQSFENIFEAINVRENAEFQPNPASPWASVEKKYPVGKEVVGTVYNLTNYGAFIKIEKGITGLLHVSDISWTRKIMDPSEVVQMGQKIKCQVLSVDKDNRRIALGLKQLSQNPWEHADERYPIGQEVVGTVRRLVDYGAFIEIEGGIDGLLRMDNMSWCRKIKHPNEMVQKGQQITCQVLSVDKNNRWIDLGLKQLSEDPLKRQIPDKYQPNHWFKGLVTTILNYGVFIRLEEGVEGLLHISEFANHEVDHPAEVMKVGDEIEIRILHVDQKERKIGLSCKHVE